MDIIGNKHIFLVFSGILVLASIAAIATWGLRFGIDFTGGSLLEIEFTDMRPSPDEIREKSDLLELGEADIRFDGEQRVLIRFRNDIDEPTHQKLVKEIGAISSISKEQFTTKVSTLGAELRRRALAALAAAIFIIIAYIAWAFRKVSKPVVSWKYGVVAVVALMHDVLIPTGVFSVLGHFYRVEADTLFITALLTILGFSVHDTIVVFDRTRENLRKLSRPEPYADTVNRSVNETIARSILTSFTVILVLVAIFFFGGESTRYFALALIIGVVFGTYSSIFVASPLLVIWNSLTRKDNMV